MKMNEKHSISLDNSKPTLKERLFPDVKTSEGLEKARTLGVLAAGYLGVAFVVTAFTAGTIFDPLPSMPADQQLTAIVSMIGAIGWFFATYRIAKRKGRIAIWLVLIYAIFSLLTKLASGVGGPGPFLSLLAVWGAINGVRAIRATKIETASEGKPGKERGLWPRRLLITWGVLSVLWLGFLFNNNWHDFAPLFNESVVIKTELTEMRTFFSNKKVERPIWQRYPVRKLEPGSTDLKAARKDFPSFIENTDAEFSEHLWGLITETRRILIATAKSRVWKIMGVWTIPSTAVLVLGFLVGWIVRKYPPSQLTPYTKKTMAVPIIWMMLAISGALILGEDFFYEEEEQQQLLLFILLPPVAFIVGAVLWRWASRKPA